MPQESNPECHWPPRSPHEALLSTPGGRDRLRRLAERASPSPSPSKRPRLTSTRPQDLPEAAMDENDEDEDEDEETLQLQLQEIQARLKLKKLQKKAKQNSDIESGSKRPTSSVFRPTSVAINRAQSRMAEKREMLERTKSQIEINVPVSPIRRAQAPPIQTSPGRVLLGIDKGLRGRDVSLNRAPSLKRRENNRPHDPLPSPFLQRPKSQNDGGSFRTTSSLQTICVEDRPKTFSERMASIRSEEAQRQERESRIQRNKSAAFNIDDEQMRSFKENAVAMPESRRRIPEFSRDEVLNSYSKPSSTIPLARAEPQLRPGMRIIASRTDNLTAASNMSDSMRSTKPVISTSEAQQSDASHFEPYSSQHLSKRIIPHQVLTRTLSGKKPFLIPGLLKTVNGPDFFPPDIEEDLVVLGVIASKSDPKSHQANAAYKGSQKGKFMVFTLTDLKWELDLFLFGSAFDKFWKLTPGTIIAILNPQIMPPPRGKEDSGKFSLTLNSDADTVLEIGTARDLGFCKSVKKDGKICSSWVDKRHTEFCDYHVNEQLKKTHASRMEVNTMTFGKKGGGYGTRQSKEKKAEEEKKMRYDRESHSQIFIGKKSTANMLDDVDFDPDAFHRGSTKEERMTRRVLAQEKERELERKLGDLGGGIGANYARVRRTDSSQTEANTSNQSGFEEPADAGALGLVGGKGTDIALSPIKRKRAMTVSSTAAVGWGSNLTKELVKMKDGDNRSVQFRSQVKKKTRFVTEKGIREAGRESFGGDVIGGTEMSRPMDDDDDDDDDDLVIVRD